MDRGETIQIQDLLGVLRRRRAILVYLTGAIFLASIFVASVLPDEYVAFATVLVQPQTISESLVQATQEGTDLTNRLNLMAMQILSRARLSRIIDELGLYPEESEEMTREEVIALMRRHIRVEPVLPEFESDNPRQVLEINTFQIYFRARSAKTAAEVANRLANDFVDEHIRERAEISGDTSDFMEGELGRLARRIQEVEENIAQVKAENSGSLPEDLPGNQDFVRRGYDALRLAQRDLSAAESDAAFYRQQAVVSVESGDASPEQRLVQLELLIAEYQARGYTEKHPDVIAANKERAQIQAGPDEAAGEEREQPRSLAQQTAEAEQRRAVLRAEAATSEIARIQEQIQEFEDRIARTPRVAERLDALNREYRHLYESFQDYSAKRLEAAVAANMELQVKGERFRVLESAVPPPRPSAPNRPLIMVMGLLVGVFLGGGVAIVREAVDSAFHTPRQLARSLQLPVLASIPGILLEQDRRERRRRQVRAIALSSLVAVFVLFGSGLGYLWVNGAPGFVAGLFEEDGAGGQAPTAAGEEG